MNKKISVIIGVLLGGAVFCVNFFFGDFVAKGQIGREDFEDVLATRDLEWSDIFGPSQDGYDLYMLVYNKLFKEPENKAIKNVASKYGFSTNEASLAARGSIAVIYNNPAFDSRNLTQREAYDILSSIQRDYNDYFELLTLQEELDVYTSPSEIFANGDLFDSGFDLVHDLDTIERILFKGVSPTSVGGDFQLGIKDLRDFFEEVEESEAKAQEIDDEVSDETQEGLSGSLPSDRAEGDTSSPEDISGLPQEESDQLEKDVCEDEDSLNTVLENFKEEEGAREKALADGDGLDSTGGTAGLVDGADESEDFPEAYSVLNENAEVNPAPSGDWSGSWCPALVPQNSRAGKGYTSVVGQSGFSSITNVIDSVLNETLSAGAAVAIGNDAISMAVGICLTTELLYKTYSSYVPGETCVKWEVDKINDLLNEVVSHTLVPNKATGNYMESAKCKRSFQPFLDMKIVAIAAPILTPPNYDLIADTSIFEEWNNFVDKYRPFLSDVGKFDIDQDTEFLLKNIPGDASMASALLDFEATKSSKMADAMMEIDNKKYSNDAQNIDLFYRTLFLEIRQMTNLFESLSDLFVKIDEDACRAIKEKPTI